MLKSLAIRLYTVAALAAAAFAQAPVYLTAALDGAQEVPAVVSPGRGYGIVRLDPATNQVRIFVDYRNLTSAATAAHLHSGAVGVNGGVIVPLAAGPAGFTGTGTLTAAQVTALQTSGTYLNVHTATFPGGEIRGQVVFADSSKFTAALAGSNEVPSNTSTGTGTAVAFLHKPDNRLVYTVTSTGLTNVTAAHFHQAAIGTNGPVVIPLNGANGIYGGVSDRLTAAQVTALEANGFYVNVHTSTFPGGEIRGQVNTVPTPRWVTPMSGANEVPANASVGFGEATLELGNANAATITVDFANLSSAATAAHIHLGAVGVNGGVVFGLTQTGPSRFTGSATLTAAQLLDLQANRYYVNVHSATFPGGEIRGQLHAAARADTFGNGCAGSNGTTPEAGVEGIPRIGGSFTAASYGALANAIGILAVGFDRDNAGPAVLPLSLALAGVPAPGCTVFTNPAATVLTFHNAVGCGSVNVALPLVPALRGTLAYTQWFLFDGAANAAGLVTSNAATATIE